LNLQPYLILQELWVLQRLFVEDEVEGQRREEEVEEKAENPEERVSAPTKPLEIQQAVQLPCDEEE
jgi:hypothetical protein